MFRKMKICISSYFRPKSIARSIPGRKAENDPSSQGGEKATTQAVSNPSATAKPITGEVKPMTPAAKAEVDKPDAPTKEAAKK